MSRTVPTTPVARRKPSSSSSRSAKRGTPQARSAGASTNKRGIRRRRSWAWRHRRQLFLAWLFVFFGIAGAAFLLSRIPLPQPLPESQSSFIYDTNGRQLALLDSGQDRVPVKIGQVPPVVTNAVISTEDRNFYRHGGVDPIGLIRATISDLRGRGSLQGGSTITQQYVKKAYVGSQRTLIRKVKEAVLAIKVERKFTKQQILELYLNTIYFGRGAYGVQSAAQAYFGKDIGQLNLPEAALLAGLIRGPEAADPARDPSVTQSRRAATLKAMVRDHHITEAQRRQADHAPLPTQQAKAAQLRVADNSDGSQYFVEYVRQLLVRQYGNFLVLGGGLRVATTLDSGMQKRANDAVYGQGGLSRSGDPAGALVAVDSEGRVRAMVGGRDYNKSKVNLALGSEGGGTGRQAGSTFKPFLLAETVKEGYSVNSAFPAPSKIVLKGQGANGQDYPVSNFENEEGGSSVDLIDATAKSLNTVYAQLEMDIGPQKLVDMAHQMGVVHGDLQPNASLVLGTSEVSVLDMAGAYSTLPDGGTHIEPQVIAKVTTANGTQLAWPQPKRATVLSRGESDIVTYCLQQVVLRGTGTGAAIGRPLAGKTGTTSDYTDAWFIGYTPKLTAAVWMGDQNAATPMHNIHGVANVNGGSIPATLFHRFMSALAADPSYNSYFGAFDTINRFPGRLLSLPSRVGYPNGTGSTPSTSVPSTSTTTKHPTSTSVPTSSTRPKTSVPPSNAPPTTRLTVPIKP
jgi:membrane peptidoglycan carboxypeptidase